MKHIVSRIYETSIRIHDRMAVLDETGQYNYGELRIKALRIAAKLIEIGFVAGDVAAIAMPRGRDYVVAMIGVWFAGGAVLTLDIDYPPDRMAFMKKDCGAKITVSEEFYHECMDAKPLSDIVHVAVNAPAYILYTSGSTGNPKGILHTFESIYACSERLNRITGTIDDDIIAIIAPFTFVAGFINIIWALSMGGCVDIVPDGARKDPARLSDYIDEHKITGFFITPKLYQLLKVKGNSLRLVMLGGEKTSEVYSDKVDLYNIYGSSEVGGLVCAFRIDRAYDNTPIGKPLSDVGLYLLDEHGNPADEGEICVSGVFAQEYVNLCELTSKVFVANPFEGIDGNRVLFHTHDFGRRLPDGNIVFINRLDWMFKVNGQRVEPGEVEAALQAVPAVRECCVKGFDTGKNTFLCAYYVPDAPISQDEIRAALARVLPSYMIPLFFVQLEKLPRNLNGKLDYNCLKMPELAQYKAEYAEPQNDVERALCQGFESVLDIKGVGIDDDFFCLGGDSIKTVLLAEACASYRISSLDIMKGRTPREIARISHCVPDYSSIEPDISEAPLSDSQMGVYLECIRNPKSTKYNIPVCYRFEGIPVGRLVSAVRKVVDCYCAFKLRVDVVHGAPYLVRDDRIELNIAVVELKEKDIDSFKCAFVRPFELETGPLYRFEIVRTEASVWLFFDIHHIVFDGASLLIFERAITRAYHNEALDCESVTPLMAAKYEEMQASSDAYRQAFSYFESKLRGVEVDSNLIPDTPDVLPDDKTSILDYHARVPLDETAKYLNSSGLTENSLFMGAFGYALAKFTGQDESLFCTVHHGRCDSAIQKTMGMFVRTLPVYVRIDEEFTPEKYLNALQDDFFDSIRNEQASFVKMANVIGVKSDIMFVNHLDHDSAVELDGIRAEYEPLDTGAGIANISFLVAKDDEGYQFRIIYKSSMYRESTVHCLAEMVDSIVNGMMRCAKLKAIPLVSERVLHLLDAFNQTESDYDRERNIVDLLREQVESHPDDTAVVYHDKSLSYREFWDLTDRVAAYIHSKNIGKNTFVAIIIGRSEFMPITAWGVVKSGAAYLPIDPAYPKERIDFMVRDSGARLLIADRDLSHLVDGDGVDVLFTDEIWGLSESSQFLFTNGDGNLVREAGVIERAMPDDALIMIYTSGTTGIPKGCIINHRNMLAFHIANMKVWQYTHDSRVASYVSFGFDPIYMDIFSSLIAGARLYIIGDDIRLDIAAIDAFYIKNNITCGYMTTQVGRMFVGITKCKTLRKFMVGGEKLIPIMPPYGIELINAYGPTETTCYVTHHIVKNDSLIQPIGRANPNTKLYIVDNNMNRLPFGACGELCIAGPQVSTGYLNCPDKTSEFFVDNPFCHDPDYMRMYKTGDIVRMLPNGEIDIVGRRDGQVKIRGYRLELSEVEKTIYDYPGILSVAVVAFEATGGGNFLAAYIVSDIKIDVHELSDFILKNKPSYMVPSSIIQLDAIPLNASGKVDKRKLRRPQINSHDAGLEPATRLEMKICEIYQQLLGVDKVYADDDFFSIGGTSILALKLVLQCMKAGIPIVYKNVFDHPTPKSLAVLVECSHKSADLIKDSTPGRDLGEDVKVLNHNVYDNIENIRTGELGRVLLTGATGFLGVHILKELLDISDRQIICLVRKNKDLTACERIESSLKYYFGDSFEVLHRIVVVEGDVTDISLEKNLEPYTFDTIMNCAACVKHFAADDMIERTNYFGVQNLISIAQKRHVRFIQMSTTSVAGESVDGSVPEHIRLFENMLDIGQNLDNKYIYSKYMAEIAVLKAISNGMSGKILRLGNLTGRLSDGKFQINFQSNAFMQQIKGYIKLGCFPTDSLYESVEFSPVDCCAHACILLASTPNEYTVFHVNNCHTVSKKMVINALNELDMTVKAVSHDEFINCFNKRVGEEKTNLDIGGLVAYMNCGHENRRLVQVDNRFTVNALNRLGFEWPKIDVEYIKRFISSVLSCKIVKKAESTTASLKDSVRTNPYEAFLKRHPEVSVIDNGDGTYSFIQFNTPV